MRFNLVESRLGLRASVTRIPFRYGHACLIACPQALLALTVEIGGKPAHGYAGDCLPPGWFDKTPGLSYRRQVADLIAAIDRARAAFAEAASSPVALFPAWLEVQQAIQAQARDDGIPPLVATFGVSLVERALIDALGRASCLPFARLVREGHLELDPGQVVPELRGLAPANWLPPAPLRSVRVRHTVGLGDALATADITPADRLDDGLPQSVEQHIERLGLRDFKLKLANRLDSDLDRLAAFARLVERLLGPGYRLTLDGNEQYKRSEDLDALVNALQARDDLAVLRSNILAVEQPLERSIALDAAHTQGIRDLAQWRPVIIDESDGTLQAYPEALALGYRGVSSKNCKGPIKSILNAGLTWLRNHRGRDASHLMTAEDLCSVGVVPVQADLCLAATLGLDHVERNGHHYHPGLSYLPRQRQEQALAAHPDFYTRTGPMIGPRVEHGRLALGSIVDATGFGFSALPVESDWTDAGCWSFESLGLVE